MDSLNVPLGFFFSYLVVGMISTAYLWSSLETELEMSIGMEEEEVQGFVRVFLTGMFVIAWPLVLWDLLRKS